MAPGGIPAPVYGTAYVMGLQDRIAVLEDELAKARDKNLLYCAFCGHAEKWDAATPLNTVRAMQQHEQECSKNPLAVRLRKLETALLKISESAPPRWASMADDALRK